MKFIHTSDWHVGKMLKGRDRLDEQRAVLAEITRIAGEHEADAVLVAGTSTRPRLRRPRRSSWWSRRC